MSAGIAQETPRIVVGIDGSPSSRAALRWAVKQARLTGSTVDAVIAWQIPTLLSSSGWAPIYVEEVGDFEAGARKTIDAVIGEEVTPADGCLVRPVVVQDHPAQALISAAKGAGMLVVGSRGHGSFADAVLGSVGQYCVHHAHCPMLIMRDETDH